MSRWKRRSSGFGMTEILVSDVNLNSVCERLEQHCCLEPLQHRQRSPPQTPVLKRHTNTGAKLWGRVRSKLLRQKVSLIHTQAVSVRRSPLDSSSSSSPCHLRLFVLLFSVFLCVPFFLSSFHGRGDYCCYLMTPSVVKTKLMCFQ